MSTLAELPGGDLIERGVADYAAGRVTLESCLLAIGWPRLQRGGLDLPGKTPQHFPEPEMQLYTLLRNEGGDAYSRYNALMRQLISFEQSLDQRQNS